MRSRLLAALVACAVAAALAVGCASGGGRVELPRAAGVAPVDVLVQGAVDIEVQPLLAALREAEKIQLAAWTFWRGRIGGKSVVVSLTGEGPINAAASTTVGILTFQPKLILNHGTAGAHDPQLKIFDIIMGRATVDFGAFETSEAGVGQGVSLSRWKPIRHKFSVDGGPAQEVKQFPGDAAALRVAGGAPYPHGRLVPGVIGSAFEFNNELDRLNWLRATYGTASEDMESAFAAGAAYGFQVPFAAFRVIANSAFLTDPPQEVSARYCAEFVVEVIKRLP